MAAYGVSPSPNPLPLGEGRRLAPLHRPDGYIAVATARILPGFWIPAYAGMTVGMSAAAMGLSLAGCGFPLSRE